MRSFPELYENWLGTYCGQLTIPSSRCSFMFFFFSKPVLNNDQDGDGTR